MPRLRITPLDRVARMSARRMNSRGDNSTGANNRRTRDLPATTHQALERRRGLDVPGSHRCRRPVRLRGRHVVKDSNGATALGARALEETHATPRGPLGAARGTRSGPSAARQQRRDADTQRSLLAELASVASAQPSSAARWILARRTDRHGRGGVHQDPPPFGGLAARHSHEGSIEPCEEVPIELAQVFARDGTAGSRRTPRLRTGEPRAAPAPSRRSRAALIRGKKMLEPAHEVVGKAHAWKQAGCALLFAAIRSSSGLHRTQSKTRPCGSRNGSLFISGPRNQVRRTVTTVMSSSWQFLANSKSAESRAPP